MKKHFYILISFVYVSLCCELKDFMPCVMQLNSQKVDFNIKPLEMISNITTEAKLMHTCRTYAKIFPCFDQKIAQCGSASQKMQLDSGKRLYNYLCAPFSLQRQKIFLRRNACIQEVLKDAPTADCNYNETQFAEKMQSCKNSCKKGSCLNNIKLSEAAICTFGRIKEKCTLEAAEFYGQLQRVISNKDYPIQCHYSSRPAVHQLKKGLPEESVLPETSTSTSTFPSDQISVVDGVVSRTSMPIVRRTDPNSKSKPRPTASHSKIPIIKTLLVDEKGSPLPTISTRHPSFSPKIVHKFLPNPYTTPAPNMRNDQIRTTRTIFGNDGKYSQWTASNKTYLRPEMPVLKPAESALPSPPMNFKFKLPADQTSTQPFKVEINWMDDVETKTLAPENFASPWYLKTTPTLRVPEEPLPTTDESSPFEAVNPLLNQLRSQSLNLTELGNQANNYFSAALNAFTETKKEMTQNDPWRALIDAVAPTIQKVSPDIIPRIRDEINRIQPNKN